MLTVEFWLEMAESKRDATNWDSEECPSDEDMEVDDHLDLSDVKSALASATPSAKPVVLRGGWVGQATLELKASQRMMASKSSSSTASSSSSPQPLALSKTKSTGATLSLTPIQEEAPSNPTTWTSTPSSIKPTVSTARPVPSNGGIKLPISRAK